MASSLKYKRTIVDKVSVKGILDGSGTAITYKNEDKDECEITVAELLNDFKGQPIDFSVSLKTEEELDLPSEDDE